MRSAGFLTLDREKIGTKLYGYVLAKRYTSHETDNSTAAALLGGLILQAETGLFERRRDLSPMGTRRARAVLYLGG